MQMLYEYVNSLMLLYYDAHQPNELFWTLVDNFLFFFFFFFFWHNFISIIIVILNQKVISHSSKITNFGVYMNQENNLLHENNTFQFTDWLLRLIVKSSFEMRIRQEKEYCVCIHFAHVWKPIFRANLFFKVKDGFLSCQLKLYINSLIKTALMIKVLS